MTATATARRVPPMVDESVLSQIWKVSTAKNEIFDQSRARYGDAFGMNINRGKFYFLAHPDQVKEVFTASPEVLHAGKGNEILATALGEHSVLLLDGSEHMRQRKLLLPSFHGEKLEAQTGAMERISEEVVASIPRGESFHMRETSQKIALEVILEIVLGTASTGEQHDRLGKATRELLEWIGKGYRLALSSVFGPRSRPIKRMYKPALAPLDQGLYELIAERRQATGLEDRHDILSMLLLARDEDGQPMTDLEIRDELVTLIVAGHETTATALAWAFERLTRVPGGTERLHEEAVAGEGEYARWVSQEALRLRPVLDFVLRRVMEPIEIGGYQFGEGDVLAPSIYLVHRREDVYPDPLAFKPERWDGVKPGTYTWFPFGGGVRRCIGMQFAMAEMEIVMKAVARAGILLPVGPQEPAVARFITSSPKRGGQVRFAF
ncbi:MAG TPA: cytochrome P450 [Solirubrobacterales bacterium]|nr:cytochrome P450 [Solirubrobacterales bacterium]HNH86415.1 cytochrome P450 [Solirubrobacterales bacterium]HNO97366.1 cytochrome P450 [Solirubrobacterales bacterium]